MLENLPFATINGEYCEVVLEVKFNEEGLPGLGWAKLQKGGKFRACLIVLMFAAMRGFAWYRRTASAIRVRRWGEVVLAKDLKSIQGEEEEEDDTHA